jgi:flavoprotein
MREIGMKEMEKKIKMLEAEIESLYKENEHLVKMYKAIQELQDMHDAPANAFTYYLG